MHLCLFLAMVVGPIWELILFIFGCFWHVFFPGPASYVVVGPIGGWSCSSLLCVGFGCVPPLGADSVHLCSVFWLV